MFAKILKVIKNRKYDLSDMLKKIEKIWLQGQITKQERDDLYEAARENADPQRSLVPMEEQFVELSKTVKDLMSRVILLEKRLDGQEIGNIDAYQPYIKPSRIIDCYNAGDKVLWRNQKYVCMQDNTVWNPEDYPAAWKRITENEEK